MTRDRKLYVLLVILALNYAVALLTYIHKHNVQSQLVF